MKRFDFRAVARGLLVLLALVIIIGAAVLALLNHSLSWQMYARRADVRVDENGMHLEVVLEMSQPGKLLTGFLLNPGLEVESIQSGGVTLTHRRFSSLVLIGGAGKVPLEDGRAVFTVRASGIPVNPADKEAASVLNIDDEIWALTPAALWLPTNAKAAGSLELKLTLPQGWTAVLPGQPQDEELPEAAETVSWLMPSGQEALVAGRLAKVDAGETHDIWVDPQLGWSEAEQGSWAEQVEAALHYLNSLAGMAASSEDVVLLHSDVTGTWSNLHMLSSRNAQNMTHLMRELGAGKWDFYFADGKYRDWMADSLVAYIAMLYQDAQGEIDLRHTVGALTEQYRLQSQQGYRAKLTDLGDVDEATYQAVGLPKAVLFWRRLHAEIGDDGWTSLLAAIQRSGTISAAQLPSVVGSAADDRAANVCRHWLDRSPEPTLYISQYRATPEGAGNYTLDVVVWQRRPIVPGSVMVRVYGPNGEVAEKRVELDVISHQATFALDFQPQAITLDEDNTWLNRDGNFRLRTLSSLIGTTDAKVVFPEGESLSAEARAEAARSMEALVNYLRSVGMNSAVATSDQATNWDKLAKQNIVLLVPTDGANAMMQNGWEQPVAAGADLSAYTLGHPASTARGVWIFTGDLPETQEQWRAVLSHDVTSGDFSKEFRLLNGELNQDAWFRVESLYKVVEIKK
ncbi:MAG: hypothetical protein ACOX18_08030 [Bacillota bacterium]